MGEEPQADVLRFFKWIKKEQKIDIGNCKALDLGCGTGRNSNHLASLGADVTGIEIASNALNEAKRRAQAMGVSVRYIEQSIGERWPIEDDSIDLILDVTSSNSLSETERETYLKEIDRVLKPDGFAFVRALCKDGDKNAKELIKQFPGPEKDTYVLKGVGITERVFTEADFRSAYSSILDILKLEKKTGYQRWGQQSYKRNYWLGYMRKSQSSDSSSFMIES